MQISVNIQKKRIPIKDYEPLMAYFKAIEYNFCKTNFRCSIIPHSINIVMGIKSSHSRVLVGSVCWHSGTSAVGFGFSIKRETGVISIRIFNDTTQLIDVKEKLRLIIKELYQDIHNKFVVKTLNQKKGRRPHPSLFAIKRSKDNHADTHFVNAKKNGVFTNYFIKVCNLLKIQYN